MKFKELNLPNYIMDGLEKQGFENPTEIQEKCIPLIMEGVDIIGKSETGSGKTYAYGIPAIIGTDSESVGISSLIICPTRELASQVCDEMRKLCDLKRDCKVSLVVGGNSFEKQLEALKRDKTKIVIGTPGRIMDHLRKKTLKLDNIKLVILDEADEMLNMGFKEDIETILKSTKTEHQTVMFSATMPKPILALTNDFMKNPKMVELSNANDTSKLIKQYYVNAKNKNDAIQKLFTSFNPARSVIFCNTKRMVEEVSKSLKLSGLSVLELHGDMRQRERKATMLEFKAGKANILVATDVAARGIDVKDINIIFNYDIPHDIEYYIHRIGRTGRAGKSGIAITLVNSNQQRKLIDSISKETNGIIEEYKTPEIEQYSNVKERGNNLRQRRPERTRSDDRNKSFKKPRSEKTYSSRSDKDNSFLSNKNKKYSFEEKEKREFPKRSGSRDFSKSESKSSSNTNLYRKNSDEKGNRSINSRESYGNRKSSRSYDKNIFEKKESKRESKFNAEFSKQSTERPTFENKPKRSFAPSRFSKKSNKKKI